MCVCVCVLVCVCSAARGIRKNVIIFIFLCNNIVSFVYHVLFDSHVKAYFKFEGRNLIFFRKGDHCSSGDNASPSFVFQLIVFVC